MCTKLSGVAERREALGIHCTWLPRQARAAAVSPTREPGTNEEGWRTPVLLGHDAQHGPLLPERSLWLVGMFLRLARRDGSQRFEARKFFFGVCTEIVHRAVVRGGRPGLFALGLLPAVQCEEASPCQDSGLRANEPVDATVLQLTSRFCVRHG